MATTPTIEKCCICSSNIEWKYTPEGEVYWWLGDNAGPVATGQCCQKCHNQYVLPCRVSRVYTREEALGFLKDHHLKLPQTVN